MAICKVGDWVCPVCGGRDFTFYVGYLVDGTAQGVATIDDDGNLAWSVDDTTEDDICVGEPHTYRIRYYVCEGCELGKERYLGDGDKFPPLIKLTLGGPYPSQWSAHDKAEFESKNQQKEKKNAKGR